MNTDIAQQPSGFVASDQFLDQGIPVDYLQKSMTKRVRDGKNSSNDLLGQGFDPWLKQYPHLCLSVDIRVHPCSPIVPRSSNAPHSSI